MYKYSLSLFLPLFKYGNFIDNLRIFAKGGSGGMGYPRLGGEGGRGGDVWVVAHKNMTLKQLKSKYPQKRFVAGGGANSRWVPIEWFELDEKQALLGTHYRTWLVIRSKLLSVLLTEQKPNMAILMVLTFIHLLSRAPFAFLHGNRNYLNRCFFPNLPWAKFQQCHCNSSSTQI